MGRPKDRDTIRRTKKGAARVREPSAERERIVVPAAASDDSGDESMDDRAPDSLRIEDMVPESSPELGRYQLLFELARGGMGTVHVGRLRGAHGFDRLVAIKQLKTDGATPEDVDAFLAEARITARVNHPNVVQTLELGEHDGRPFIVMELIRGVSLSRLLRRIKRANARLPAPMVMWIGQRIATGLHAAHELSLIHRDVSPENVILSFDGRVCVADFGVAKFTEADKHTQSGVVKGKFAYMSPEQTEAAELDPRSDLFALGIVLHEALTGERLFAADTMAATVRRVWSITPKNPREVAPDVPEALVPVVMRCLEKDRGDRYDTAREVAADLRRILRAEGHVPDDADLADLIRQYFPTERAHLQERIEEAVHAMDESNPRQPSSRSLEISPAHGALSAHEQTQQGSVTASITTGPPLSPRNYAGAGLAVAAAVVIGAGLWLTQRGAATPSGGAPERPVASAEDVGDVGEPDPRAASSAPVKASATPATSATTTATVQGSARGPTIAPKPILPTPRSTAAPKAGPKPTPPPPAPTRGRPIDIFGE